MEEQTRIEEQTGLSAAWIKRIKIAIGVIAVLVVATLVFFVVRELRSESIVKRWDEFARIQGEYEPTERQQDPLFEGPGDVYRTRRARYIESLEAFLPRAEENDDALAPQVHWLLAKLSLDQVMSMKDELDASTRRAYWERAKSELEILRDRYPGYQTNWLAYAPEGDASLTRAMLSTIDKNLAWEKENLPGPVEPSSDPVVVVRTERGDLRLALFAEQAPMLTTLFLERALRGDYDGTFFFARTDQRQDGAPVEVAARGGHPKTRGAQPYDRAGHAAFATEEDVEVMLPELARWAVPATRGVVMAWHPDADEYDGAQQILVVTERSPALDHRFTPLARLVDDASLATADRLASGATWADDDDAPDVPADVDAPDVDMFLQAPVRIVKVLVYENGELKSTSSAAATKAEADETEAKLATLVADAYATEPPAKPARVSPPESPTEEEDDDAVPSDG